jgi:membrane protease YdiL (CAAX protease family)
LIGDLLRAAGLVLAAGLGCALSALALSRLARRGRELPAHARVPGAAIAAGAAVFLVTQFLQQAFLDAPPHAAHPLHLARVLLSLLAALATMHLAGARARWFLPLHERRPLRFALKAYAAALPAMVGVWLLYAAAADLFGFSAQHEILAGFSSLEPGQRLLTLGLAVFLMPLAEEALFRGFLFAGLAADLRFGPLRALAFSSLAFGLAHPPAMWLPGTCLGLLFGWVHWRVGDLRAPMLLHVLHNGLVFLLTSL